MNKDELISQRAYDIWNEQGQPHGLSHEHWEQARREIEAESPPEPDANGPTGAELPDNQSSPQPEGETLKASTELG